jgi:hypothetical protein
MKAVSFSLFSRNIVLPILFTLYFITNRSLTISYKAPPFSVVVLAIQFSFFFFSLYLKKLV